VYTLSHNSYVMRRLQISCRLYNSPVRQVACERLSFICGLLSSLYEVTVLSVCVRLYVCVCVYVRVRLYVCVCVYVCVCCLSVLPGCLSVCLCVHTSFETVDLISTKYA
jgi:hypothetical protein